jgi:hypothetical protein
VSGHVLHSIRRAAAYFLRAGDVARPEINQASREGSRRADDMGACDEIAGDVGDQVAPRTAEPDWCAVCCARPLVIADCQGATVGRSIIGCGRGESRFRDMAYCSANVRF